MEKQKETKWAVKACKKNVERYPKHTRMIRLRFSKDDYQLLKRIAKEENKSIYDIIDKSLKYRVMLDKKKGDK